MEERFGIALRIKGDEVIYLFADADVVDGDAHLFIDGKSDAAFGCAVDFSEDEAR